MSQLDDLSQVAEDLRKRGVAVDEEYVYSLHGGVEGLQIGDDFFPHWELDIAENRAALVQADFAAIKSRRGPDWSVEPVRPIRGT
jgi:hypothetical protein